MKNFAFQNCVLQIDLHSRRVPYPLSRYARPQWGKAAYFSRFAICGRAQRDRALVIATEGHRTTKARTRRGILY